MKEIDVAKEWDKEDKESGMGLKDVMKLLNPKNLIKMSKEVNKGVLADLLGKKVVVEQASNGYIITLFRGKEEKILCKDISVVMKHLERFFEGRE